MPGITATRSWRRFSGRPRNSITRRRSSFAHPQGLRTGEPHRGAGARRSRPRVLLQLRLRGGRYGAQDRDRLSQCPRRRAARTRLIGRERGYHGVGFGGISVGGIVQQPQDLRRARDRASIICRQPIAAQHQAFTKGEPEWGAHLADELETHRRRCTTPRPSPPSSSSRWRARPACCRRRKAICRSCAPSATNTEFS